MNTSINKHALTFGFISVFLTGLGLTIVSPVLPFLVKSYTSDSNSQATAITLITSIYALSVFLAAPVLGALSDRYGRRPVLIISLIGSSLGYFIFGLGGALATFGNSVPLYAGAILTLLNAIYGYFFMPESLEKPRRSSSISAKDLNPFIQLSNIFSFKSIKWLLITGFLIWIPNGSLQAIFSQFSIDTFAWKPVLIGLTFSIMGVLDIISQAIIMPRLLKLVTDKKIALLGMINEIIGYIFIAVSALTAFYPLFIVGMIFFGFGDSIFGPSFNGMLSKSVSIREQGRILGGSQSIQSLARVIGPIIGGQLYSIVSHSTPAIMGIILIGVSALVLSNQHG
ncbi:MFS transporter [Heyndrickxia oleronia]|uniref:MFS transporter n=1 Tax=Heyndrickxia oleronia TaxID=38875 RepID=UPI001B2B6D5E|nr:MFS transporter [Heyndrickxia oleronia]GIN40557.1 tetracycline resistance MFS efflux pump [Heyndrickxia oleronia]